MKPAELCRAGSVAMREVMGFPTRLMSDLPAPWSMHCVYRGNPLLFSTESAVVSAARVSKTPCFDGREFANMAILVENERANKDSVAEWINKKTRDPYWHLGVRREWWALGPEGMYVDHARKAQWPVWRVLDYLDIALTADIE